MKRISERAQRTISMPAQVQGIGYLTGKNVHLRFVPAPARTGIYFVRTDLGLNATLPAHVNQVTGTQRRTTLGHGPLTVSLVEHVLAALRGLRIDNCRVEVDAPEPPGLDGSAQPFADALCQAGIVVQSARKAIWGVTAAVTAQQADATLTLHPSVDSTSAVLRASYLLNYGDDSAIVRQAYTVNVTPAEFLEGIACCRTFVTHHEAILLQQQGLGLRTTTSDLVVFGPHGPIDNKLHFANEPARHKILDLIGDLTLLGEDICGHIVAYRSGHSLNIELVRELAKLVDKARVEQRAA